MYLTFTSNCILNRGFLKIKFQNRLKRNASRSKEKRRLAKISVDGVDLLKKEDFPFDPKYASHKFGNSPAFSYEISLSIVSYDVVWVNGPFKGGSPDLNNFRYGGLKEVLARCNEMVVTDSGYRDERVRLRNEGLHEERNMNSLIRARQETVNQRIKNFGCMSQRWRGKKHDHFAFLQAVIGLVQIELKYKPLMKLNGT